MCAVLQVAALNLTQSLAADLWRGVRGGKEAAVGGSEASTPASESVPARSHRDRERDRERSSPGAILITQLTEMGFSRKSVEYTMKVLGTRSNELPRSLSAFLSLSETEH